MIISAIVAVAEDHAIGKDNHLPWHLPDDFKFFKNKTMGKPMLMGRKTFESLGGVLKGRLHIVVSRQKDLQLPEGVLHYDNVQDAMERMLEEQTDEAFIIGGGMIFDETLNLLDRMYITLVHTTIPDAETFFPHIDHTHWKLVWHEDHAADEKHKYAFTFQQWERVKEI